jgi:hypothetical protein
VSVALYFDHNVRTAISFGLRERGVDVLVAYEDGYAEADDATILQRATSLNRVAFSNDDDFLAVGDDWQRVSRTFTGVIYVHQMRLTIGETIVELEVLAKAGNPEDPNQIVYLPL